MEELEDSLKRYRKKDEEERRLLQQRSLIYPSSTGGEVSYGRGTSSRICKAVWLLTATIGIIDIYMVYIYGDVDGRIESIGVSRLE